MTITELKDLFEKHEDEHLRFERVENKLARRADVHAFMLLDGLFELQDGEIHDIIGSAHHDEYYLSLDGERLAQVLTEAHVIELLRCGITYDSHHDALQRFT